MRMLLIEPETLFRRDRSLDDWDKIHEKLKRHGTDSLYEKLHGNSYLFALGQASISDKSIQSIFDELKQEATPGIVVELIVDPGRLVVSVSPFQKIWSQVMKRAEIPYERDSRRETFAKAYDTLDDYMRLWRHPAAGGWREALLGSKTSGVDSGMDYSR